MRRIKDKKNFGKRLLAAVLTAAVFAGSFMDVQAAESVPDVDQVSDDAQIHSHFVAEPSASDDASISDEEQEVLAPKQLITIWKGVALSEPQSFDAQAVKNGIELSWKKNSKVQKYELYRKQAGDTKYTLIKTTKKNSYTDTKAEYGVTYTYKVRAVKVLDGRVYTSGCSKTKSCCSYRIDPSKPMVALTYDDGPGIYTARILDTLKKYNARATFFEVGNRVGLYPQTVKRIDEMGCELGNHSYDHANLGTANVSKIQTELNQTDSKIKSLTGKAPALIRPPYGSIGANLRNYAGKPLILWSIDTLDWKTRNASSVYQSVMSRVKDGDIILMHDLYASTADATARIVPDLIARGYQLVTVSELAEYKKVTLRAGQSYSRM